MKRNQADSLIRVFVYLWLLTGICFKAHGQVAVTPFVTTQPQFLDNNSNPLAAGCLFTYAAGTTNNQATYTDSAGLVQNANPIILTSGGFPPSQIFLTSQSYKFVLKSFGGTACASGSTIRTEDNVKAPVSANLANTFTGTTTFNGPIVSSGTNTFSGSNTFSGAVFLKTVGNRVYADQFSGADYCAKVNTAALTLQAALPSGVSGVVDATNFTANQTCSTNMWTGVTAQILVVQGTFQVNATVLAAQQIVACFCRYSGSGSYGSFWVYSPTSGTSWQFAYTATPTGVQWQAGMDNMILDGLANGGSGATSIGIMCGIVGAGAAGCVGAHIDNTVERQFSIGIQFQNNSFFNSFIHNIQDSNAICIQIPVTTGTQVGEQEAFVNNSCVSSTTAGLDAQSALSIEPVFQQGNFDNNAIAIRWNSAGTMTCTACHIELFTNAQLGVVHSGSGHVTFLGGQMMNDASSGTIANYINMTSSGSLSVFGTEVRNQAGATLTNFVQCTGCSGQLTVLGERFVGTAPSVQGGFGFGNLVLVEDPSSPTLLANGINAGGVGVTTSKLTMTNMLASTAVPTISSGFGTSPSVASNNGTANFTVNVGTGGVASTGVIGLPSTNGWNCTCQDVTTTSATVFACKQTGAGTSTTAPIGNFNTSGVAAAWVASDILNVSCMAR